MSGRDRLFLLGTAVASAILPTLLIMGRPFDEPRATMGVLTGWILALVVVVPSYFILLAALRAAEPRKFQTAFMGGTMGRFFVSMVAIACFVLLVEDAPIRSFMVSFFLGYMVLTGLEVGMALGSAKGRHA